MPIAVELREGDVIKPDEVIAPEVMVPVVLIAVDPPMVPEVIAEPTTLPAVDNVGMSASINATAAVTLP